jgi:hypothetical protein
MIGSKIAQFIVVLFYVLESVVMGTFRVVVAILGPGLTVFLIAVAAVVWYLGWIPI